MDMLKAKLALKQAHRELDKEFSDNKNLNEELAKAQHDINKALEKVESLQSVERLYVCEMAV